MKLSETPCAGELELVRDGAFSSLGFVTHRAPDMLVYVESERFLGALEQAAHVSCAIVAPALAARVPSHIALALSATPRLTFYQLHNQLAESDFYLAPFPTQIAASARVHPRAFVAEHSVRIGERVVIEPNATIMGRTLIDDDTIVRAGAVIGGEGFQAIDAGGKLLSIKHGGGVHLEREVEIQQNSCVDRALFGGYTLVGEGTKVDNLVQIAHNVRLGKRNRLAAGAMLAGSVVTGDDVWIGPQAAISSEVELGDRASITLGAVVTRNVASGERVSGNFAVPHDRFLEFVRSIR